MCDRGRPRGPWPPPEYGPDGEKWAQPFYPPGGEQTSGDNGVFIGPGGDFRPPGPPARCRMRFPGPRIPMSRPPMTPRMMGPCCPPRFRLPQPPCPPNADPHFHFPPRGPPPGFRPGIPGPNFRRPPPPGMAYGPHHPGPPGHPFFQPPERGCIPMDPRFRCIPPERFRNPGMCPDRPPLDPHVVDCVAPCEPPAGFGFRPPCRPPGLPIHVMPPDNDQACAYDFEGSAAGQENEWYGFSEESSEVPYTDDGFGGGFQNEDGWNVGKYGGDFEESNTSTTDVKFGEQTSEFGRSTNVMRENAEIKPDGNAPDNVDTRDFQKPIASEDSCTSERNHEREFRDFGHDDSSRKRPTTPQQFEPKPGANNGLHSDERVHRDGPRSSLSQTDFSSPSRHGQSRSRGRESERDNRRDRDLNSRKRSSSRSRHTESTPEGEDCNSKRQRLDSEERSCPRASRSSSRVVDSTRQHSRSRDSEYRETEPNGRSSREDEMTTRTRSTRRDETWDRSRDDRSSRQWRDDDRRDSCQRDVGSQRRGYDSPQRGSSVASSRPRDSSERQRRFSPNRDASSRYHPAAGSDYNRSNVDPERDRSARDRPFTECQDQRYLGQGSTVDQGRKDGPSASSSQSKDGIPGPIDVAEGTDSGSQQLTATEKKYSNYDDIFDVDFEEEDDVIPDWIRSSPADVCFKRDKATNVLVSTKRMQDLERKFEHLLVRRAERVRSAKPPVVLPPRKPFVRRSRSPSPVGADEDAEVESGAEDDAAEHEERTWMAELTWRKNHPERLHDELWFNLPQEMNDGPLCRCNANNIHYGIRHNIYPGETPLVKCDSHTNNPDKLYHYRVTMSPHTNFLIKSPTLIEYDSHEYIFEGFSLFSHYKIKNVPVCKVIRFNIEYTIHYFEEDMIENFDVRSLDLFADFLYREILELVDLDWAGKDYEGTCRRFHIMPRFSRPLPDNGKEILSMNEVLNYMLRSSKKLVEETELANLLKLDEHEWQNFVGDIRGMIVTYPGMRPCSLRIDQLDREQTQADVISFPKIIHFGVRPAQLSYAGDSTYQKLWKMYIRMKHLVTNQPKVQLKDREKLRQMEEQLQDIRLKGTMKRETTVEISSEGFLRTGIKADICQHALLLPVLIQHLLFHKCLDILEERISYPFKDRLLLQLALTHPSFRMNYGTNADHARNSLTNCGKRQLEYGDKRIHFIHTRKRGINTLMHIMSKMARTEDTPSEIHHYERLEFLGDAVIEFLSSIHLFFMFPRLEEGGLATYRAALVQNQHLTVLAEKLGLQHFILYAHGPDLCHERNIKHALANCFEALMGSLFLDGGIEVADHVFGEVLFKDQPDLYHVWIHLPLHPLQEDEPKGDRHWIVQSQPLQHLLKFEEATGIVFNHIRLLARSFTMRNIGYNNLTLGHNQTLEFLGDTILQLISSEYLYKHFPDHHEGHLTLLRSSLVNNRTQAIICDDLGMTRYVINNDLNVKERIDSECNKVKDKADIVEAFIGALYVDQGLSSCKVFCQVCFFPRLKEFIIHQDWNDAKSQLQQCCLTLRDTSVGEPDIPCYKVLQSIGPTNTRKYHVAVYFRGERLATGIGHSIQQAEMNTAANALREKADMFPHLLHTKQFLDWRFGRELKEADEEDVDKAPCGKYPPPPPFRSRKSVRRPMKPTKELPLSYQPEPTNMLDVTVKSSEKESKGSRNLTPSAFLKRPGARFAVRPRPSASRALRRNAVLRQHVAAPRAGEAT